MARSTYAPSGGRDGDDLGVSERDVYLNVYDLNSAATPLNGMARCAEAPQLHADWERHRFCGFGRSLILAHRVFLFSQNALKYTKDHRKHHCIYLRT